jgi:hypothetical protein
LWCVLKSTVDWRGCVLCVKCIVALWCVLKSTVDWRGGVLSTKLVACIITCVRKLCQAAMCLNDLRTARNQQRTAQHTTHSLSITLPLITGTSCGVLWIKLKPNHGIKTDRLTSKLTGVLNTCCRQ